MKKQPNLSESNPLKTYFQFTEGACGHAPPVPHRHEHRGGEAGLPQPHPVLAPPQSHTL
jgi:hypothetical protein